MMNRRSPLDHWTCMVECFHRGSDQVEKNLMIEVSGGCDHDPFRVETARDKVDHLLAAGLFNGLNSAIDRQAQRVLLPEIFLEKHMDELIGRVLDHPDFLKDDVLFAFDLHGCKDRFEKDIRKKIGQQWKVGGKDFSVKTDMLLRGESIGKAADC